MNDLTNEVFGHWLPIFGEPLILKYRKMLIDATLSGIPIAPDAGRVFHCFRDLQPEDIKVCILGQDPYADGNATGLAFANDPMKDGFKGLSPSLKVIRDSVLSLADSKELPIFDPTLESWKKQGILLLNSALTVRMGQPGSHLVAWKPFIQRVLTGLSAETNCCFLLFGKVAWSFKDCIFENRRGVFMEYHPAYYARTNTKMPNTIWKDTIDYVRENYTTELKLYD